MTLGVNIRHLQQTSANGCELVFLLVFHIGFKYSPALDLKMSLLHEQSGTILISSRSDQHISTGQIIGMQKTTSSFGTGAIHRKYTYRYTA